MVQWNRRSNSSSEEEDEQIATHLGTQTPAWHSASNTEIATQTAQQPILEQATQTAQPVTQGTPTQTEELLQAGITSATTATLTKVAPRLCNTETVRKCGAHGEPCMESLSHEGMTHGGMEYGSTWVPNSI